jgi:hypothetical protein
LVAWAWSDFQDLSSFIQTKRYCRLIVPRSVTLIGTAPDAARYSTARFLFGSFASMVRPKLNLRPGPDAALIFMKGIGIPPRTKKSRVEKWEWQITVCTPSVTMGILSTAERSPAIPIPTQSSGQSS